MTDGNAVWVRETDTRHGWDAISFGSGLAVRGNSFDLDAELALQLKEIRALLPQEKRGGNAAFTGAAGTADTMDEVFSNIG